MKSDKSKSPIENQSVNSEHNRPQSLGSLSVEVAGAWASEFVDNRPIAIAQRKLRAMVEQNSPMQRVVQLQAIVNDSPRVQAQGKLQEMVDSSPRQLTQQQQSVGMFDQSVQRQGPEDEELLQGKMAPIQRQGVEVGGQNCTGMPDSLKGRMQTLSGLDLSGVRVHHNSAKPAQLNALGYLDVGSQPGGVIQPAWLKSDEKGHRKWDKNFNGYEWFYNPNTDKMYFVFNEEQSEEKTYLEWLKEGWLGLKDRELKEEMTKDESGRPREETSDEKWQRYLNQGRQIYESQQTRKKLVKDSSKEQEWEKNYLPFTEPANKAKDCTDVYTGFTAKYQEREKLKLWGKYHNRFNLKTGDFMALSNFRMKEEELQNSDVLYFQLQYLGATGKLETVTRTSVINVATRPLKSLLRDKGLWNDGEELTTKMEAFYVLLNSPNVKSAGYLFVDWGSELNIGRMVKLTINGDNVTVTYEKF